jgi:hypothetical protein
LGGVAQPASTNIIISSKAARAHHAPAWRGQAMVIV